MAGKLDAALAWAARGFRVFPLQVNSRLPLDMAWTSAATTDATTIRSWWTDPVTGTERDNNIGCLTTDWIVADVDTKHGKQGLQTFMGLGLDFDTLTNRTPSGGYHVFYRSIDRPVGSGHLVSSDDGVDIRSTNAYVVAPGSTIDGASYRIEIDVPVGEFPEDLRDKLKAPRERKTRPLVGVELDSPEIVEIAVYYLEKQAHNAPQGNRGFTCYQVTTRLRDLGISEELSADLMLQHWNERNSPPMDEDDLRVTVTNAFNYARGQAGSASPVAAFGGVEIVPAAATALALPMNSPPEPVELTFRSMMNEDTIETRPWIFGNILLEGAVTELVSSPGGGKSVFTLTLAAHIAVGKPFMGHACLKAGKSIIYNAEDDHRESSRRLNAICSAYGLDREIVRQNVMLLCSDDLELNLANGRPLSVNTEQIEALIRAASLNEVVMIGFDPLIEIHSVNENDSVEMRFALATLRLIARRAACAVLVIHHTPKPPTADSSSWAGNQHAGRGSSAANGAVRIFLTLFPAAEQDCTTIGVSPERRKEFVRLDGAKNSYSVLGPTQWLRWNTVTINNGENVGVLVEHDAGEAHRAMLRDLGEQFVEAMVSAGSGSLTLEEAGNILRRRDPFMDKLDRTGVKRRIERLLGNGVAVAQGTLAVVESTEDGKKSARIVLR